MDEVKTSDVLGVVDLAFKLAPRDERGGRLGIVDADPAGAHHFMRKEKERDDYVDGVRWRRKNKCSDINSITIKAKSIVCIIYSRLRLMMKFSRLEAPAPKIF